MKEIIHIVLGKANPDRMNGVNKVVHQLATQQTLAGKKVRVWGISKSLEKNYSDRVFETKLFKAHTNPFKLDRLLIEAVLNKGSEATFHIHGGWIPLFSSLSKLFNKNGISFVITPHGAYNTIAMKRNYLVKKIYFHLFEKALLTRASKIHCIGQSEVAGTNYLMANTKSVLIPYGYNNTLHGEKAELKTEFIVGFVGRLDVYTKGIDLLLTAFAQFQKMEKNSALWIVGDSKEREKILQLLDEKKIKNAILWGSVFGLEKDNLMKQMSVFAHPSRNEGLPASVLEAAAMGIPVIVTEATNVGTYVQQFNAGLCIANNSSEELTKALLTLKQKWNNDQLVHERANATQMVKEAFAWSNIVPQFDTLYQ